MCSVFNAIHYYGLVKLMILTSKNCSQHLGYIKQRVKFLGCDLWFYIATDLVVYSQIGGYYANKFNLRTIDRQDY